MTDEETFDGLTAAQWDRLADEAFDREPDGAYSEDEGDDRDRPSWSPAQAASVGRGEDREVDYGLIIDRFKDYGVLDVGGWRKALTRRVMWDLIHLIRAKDLQPTALTDDERIDSYQGCNVHSCPWVGLGRTKAHYHDRAFAKWTTLVANEEQTGRPWKHWVTTYDPALRDRDGDRNRLQTVVPHYVLLDLDPRKTVATWDGMFAPDWEFSWKVDRMIKSNCQTVLLKFDLQPRDQGNYNGIKFPMFGPRTDGTDNFEGSQKVPKGDRMTAIGKWNEVRFAVQKMYQLDTDPHEPEVEGKWVEGQELEDLL